MHIIEARVGLYAALIGDFRNGMFEPHIAMKLSSGNWSPGEGWNLAAFVNR